MPCQGRGSPCPVLRGGAGGGRADLSATDSLPAPFLQRPLLLRLQPLPGLGASCEERGVCAWGCFSAPLSRLSPCGVCLGRGRPGVCGRSPQTLGRRLRQGLGGTPSAGILWSPSPSGLRPLGFPRCGLPHPCRVRRGCPCVQEEKQPLKEGVQDMLVKHHLFSWDIDG